MYQTAEAVASHPSGRTDAIKSGSGLNQVISLTISTSPRVAMGKTYHFIQPGDFAWSTFLNVGRGLFL